MEIQFSQSELNWNNLRKLSYYTNIFENKTALLFYRRKQNKNHHEEIVEDPC